jgi:hypothetical protein
LGFAQNFSIVQSRAAINLTTKKNLVIALRHFSHCLKNYFANLGNQKNSVASFGHHNW